MQISKISIPVIPFPDPHQCRMLFKYRMDVKCVMPENLSVLSAMSVHLYISVFRYQIVWWRTCFLLLLHHHQM